MRETKTGINTKLIIKLASDTAANNPALLRKKSIDDEAIVSINS